MELVLKKGATKKEIAEIEKKLYKNIVLSGFNAKKYNGIFSKNLKPMTIQKKLRNEWERNFG